MSYCRLFGGGFVSHPVRSAVRLASARPPRAGSLGAALVGLLLRPFGAVPRERVPGSGSPDAARPHSGTLRQRVSPGARPSHPGLAAAGGGPHSHCHVHLVLPCGLSQQSHHVPFIAGQRHYLPETRTHQSGGTSPLQHLQGAARVHFQGDSDYPVGGTESADFDCVSTIMREKEEDDVE